MVLETQLDNATCRVAICHLHLAVASEAELSAQKERLIARFLFLYPANLVAILQVCELH